MLLFLSLGAIVVVVDAVVILFVVADAFYVVVVTVIAVFVVTAVAIGSCFWCCYSLIWFLL